MDAKITKKRLGLMLSYDWFKMVLTAAAFIVVWALVFTTSATRITSAQEFSIFNYTGTYVGSRFNYLPAELKKGGAFSYDVLKINATDVTLADGQDDTLMSSRITINDADAVFVAKTTEGLDSVLTYQDENGETVEFTPTYLERFLMAYPPYVADFDDDENGYLNKMYAYLSPYYDGNLETGSLNKSYAEKEFRARVKRLKDKRFKTESKIKAGLQKEYERIEKLKANYLKFQGYLQDGVIVLEESSWLWQDSSGKVHKQTGYFSINLSPNKDIEKLRSVCYYEKMVKDEGGIERKVPTTENVQIVLLDCLKKKEAYGLFESLALVNHIVEEYILA